ncbi:DNA-binding transcriptional MerR regulator [Actinoplanes lutulentus]|uniref:DNA-binding transcriptional MerR regulator n=1 Tax=Actinoplanes lutulentus TaxID=1287878 RepID=A0A327YXG9_9ACTN|nr:MerR family transcriptional regulator [Actinoplanes lutulentus]MBB2948927.1 DNA-binding transcriptional MerR regulator [Actinoplanes lutulentus]RAK26290.1 DNA-binding transcriptional MerR regulator [Actinoplanes lutulentus]
MNGDDLINIGAVAAATGLTVPALRYYDEIGLLKPAQVDPGSGYRRYRQDQIADARLVCGLRAVGVPIDDVRALVGRPADQVRTALGAHRERLVAQLREMSQRIVAVDEFIEKGTPMPALRTARPVQIRVTVADVPKAAAFYTAAFDVVFNEAISSVQFGTYRSDQFFLITLEEHDREGSRQDGTRFGLLVDDVDDAHRRALEAGGTEVHPPADFAWKPRTSCVRDLDGNVIDLSAG